MLELQTKVKLPKPGFSIDYSDTISLFGSCFSDNIGNLLNKHKFSTCINPFGVLYNPASISLSINSLFEKEKFTPNDLNFLNEKWFSYSHHSSFSSVDQADCLNRINKSFKKAKSDIKKSEFVIITLGTAWIYRNKETNSVVANCHKVPSNNFTREYLNPEQIVELLSNSINKILSVNASAKIIFTVSPIRHWKDGAIENMRSKSALILAIKELQEVFSQSYYFPSFEIFMDELRDYRFYASDMLHPSELSIDYIWQIFKNSFFSPETFQINKEVEKLSKSFGHRVFNTKTNQYQKFKEKLISDSIKIEQRCPYISFAEERENLDQL